MLPRNTRTAVTPLMASIILLCITIAVSFATLAWINGLPTLKIYTEDLQATSQKWGPNCSYVDITVYNNGTQNLNLKSITVNGTSVTVIYIVGSSQISSGNLAVLRIANTFTSGVTYQLKFQTSKGNNFFFTFDAETAASISDTEQKTVTTHSTRKQ